MNRKRAIVVGALAVVAFFMLFDVRFRFEFSMPHQDSQPDPAREALYDECFAERDRDIHATAFGTIDNPDVQKLYISNNRDKARAACRAQFPERRVPVDEPFRFNLLDLQFRF